MTAQPEVMGRVFNIQRFCIHDGPGIRTTVFLAGCTLRCAWCHNPEAFAGDTARWLGAGEVLRQVMEDRDFYVNSGGGLTVSGGEPLLQGRFVRALLTAAGEQRLHRCIQTAGAVPQHVFDDVMDVVDLFQFDLKHLDDFQHCALTGVSNAPILANARHLVQRGARVEFRMPLVPGINDAPDHLQRLADLLARLGAGTLRLVPYQRTYLHKYPALGLAARCSAIQPPSRAHLGMVCAAFQARGIAVAVDG